MQLKFDVSINKDQFSNIMFSLEKMLGQLELEENDLNYRCSVDYQQLVIGNINQQKFKYPSYRDRYAKWKRKYSNEGFHKLAGDLVNNIKVFKVGTNEWMGGVTPGVVDSGGKSWFYPLGDKRGKRKVIAMYATVMELGLNNHPARPIFKDTREEYAANTWENRGIESLKKVTRNWR